MTSTTHDQLFDITGPDAVQLIADISGYNPTQQADFINLIVGVANRSPAPGRTRPLTAADFEIRDEGTGLGNRLYVAHGVDAAQEGLTENILLHTRDQIAARAAAPAPTAPGAHVPYVAGDPLPDDIRQRLDERFDHRARRDLHNQGMATDRQAILHDVANQLDSYLGKWLDPVTYSAAERQALRDEARTHYEGHEGAARLGEVVQSEYVRTRDRYRSGRGSIEDYNLINERQEGLIARGANNAALQMDDPQAVQQEAERILRRNGRIAEDHRNHLTGTLDRQIPRHKLHLGVRIATLGVAAIFDRVDATERNNKVHQLDTFLQGFTASLSEQFAALHNTIRNTEASTINLATDVPNTSTIAGLLSAKSPDAALETLTGAATRGQKMVSGIEMIHDNCADIRRNVEKYCLEAGIHPKKIAGIQAAVEASAAAMAGQFAAAQHTGGTPNYAKTTPINVARANAAAASRTP